MILNETIIGDLRMAGFLVINKNDQTFIEGKSPAGMDWLIECDFGRFYLYTCPDKYYHLIDEYDTLDKALERSKHL